VKRLTILRHASASQGGSSLDDFDRPLNDRGIESARLLGKELKRRGVSFDHVIASPALRARETLDQLARGYGDLPAVTFDREIYLAATASLLAMVRALPAKAHNPMIVGHNPGLANLIMSLVGEDRNGFRADVALGYPAGALATMEFRVADWAQLSPGAGTIVELILPRDLA